MPDGRVFRGSPSRVVEQMQALSWGRENLPVCEWLDWSAGMSMTLYGKALDLGGDTDEERAASFVRSMVRAGLARWI